MEEKTVPPQHPPVGFAPMVSPQTAVVVPVDLGGESRRMTCPHCMADISTEVKYRDGRMTHVVALILCLLGCICCCCIPYCVNSCKDADHECPNCHRHIGHYRR